MLLICDHSLGFMDFPGGSAVKTLPCGAGNAGSVPGLGKSPGQRSLVDYSSRGCKQSDTTEPTEHALVELGYMRQTCTHSPRLMAVLTLREETEIDAKLFGAFG